MSLPLRISADEINCLIHSYFQDSGFQHSAFILRKEGNLDQSPYFTKHIPRGELIELLSKALLYIETESHWKCDSIAKNCKAAFSLLEVHTCSSESNSDAATLTAERPKGTVKQNGSQAEFTVKRKASTPSDGGRSEKRAKAEPSNQDAESLLPESSKAKSMETKKPPPSRSETSTAASVDSTKKGKKKATEDVPDPAVVRLLKGHTSEIFVCAWNPVSHALLATGSKDAAVNIWNLPLTFDISEHAPPPEPPKSLKKHFSKAEQGDLTALDWAFDGSLLAIGSYDAVLRICTTSGALYFANPQHQGPIFAVRFSKDARWLLTGSLDGTACLWDVGNKELHYQYRCHTDCCLDVDWLNESTFASCGADGLIHIMRLHETKPIKTLTGHENEINQIKCSPSRTRLASCSDDHDARIWDVANILNSDKLPDPSAPVAVVMLRGHKHSVSSIQWCPARSNANEIVATCSFDGTTRLWDSITGDCLRIFSDHKRAVFTLAFSPDGKLFATGSGDGWLHVYAVADKEKKWSWFAGPEKPGIFEIDWQKFGKVNRIALALECRQVGIVDLTKVPSLRAYS